MKSVFAFTNLEGEKTTLMEHLGKNKWTIVEVWVSDCQLCHMHMPEMVAFDGVLDNARLVGISIDGNDTVGLKNANAFNKKHGVKFPTLVTSHNGMIAWAIEHIGEPIPGTPYFMIFDTEGKLVAAQGGMMSTESLSKFIKMNSPPKEKTEASS